MIGNTNTSQIKFRLCERGDGDCECERGRLDGVPICCIEPAAIELSLGSGFRLLMCYQHYHQSRTKHDPSIDEMRQEQWSEEWRRQS